MSALVTLTGGGHAHVAVPLRCLGWLTAAVVSAVLALPPVVDSIAYDLFIAKAAAAAPRTWVRRTRYVTTQKGCPA